MKLSSLVLMACVCTAQFSKADDAAIALPAGSRPSAAAQNAVESPRWNAPPAQAVAPAATADSPTTPSPDAFNSPPQPRPLVSVMVRHKAPAAAAVPAQDNPTPLSAAQNGVATSPAAPNLLSAAPPANTNFAAPATLTPAQVAGAMPINAAAAQSFDSSTPSAVAPARYNEPAATPVETSTASTTSAASSGLQPLATPVQLTAPPRINDAEVIPANSANSETIDLGKQAAAHAAAELLATSLDSTSNADQWVSLGELLVHCPEAQRAAVVQDYWRLSMALRAGVWTRDEQKRLEDIAVARKLSAVEGPMLSTARAAAAARVTEAELDETVAYAALQSATRGFDATGKYSPMDAPLVAPYNTYYSQIFANHENQRAWEIDRTLPIRWRTISDHGAAVQSALSALHNAEQAHVKSEVDLGTVLSCVSDLHYQRRDFLNTVLKYNLDIAEYASLAAPAGTQADKFVAMLIHTKPAERLSAVPQYPANTTFSGNITPQYNSSPGVRSRELPLPPPPGNDGWVPSNMRPVEGEPQNYAPASSGATMPRSAVPQTTVAPPARENEMPARIGQPSDPFAMPPSDDRYGHYGEGH